MLTQLIRYLPVINLIKKEKVKKILEFGSGSYGMGKFFNFPFVGIDVNFNDYEKNERVNKNDLMKRVILKGKNLPFKDKQFELSFSTDVMEHISKNDRIHFLKELIRVSGKFIIVAFPAGKNSLFLDKILFNFFKLFDFKIPLWLKEHLEIDCYPLLNEFDDFLLKKELKYRKFRNEGFLFHFLFMILEKVPFLNGLSTVASRNDFISRIIRTDKKSGYRLFYIIKL